MEIINHMGFDASIELKDNHYEGDVLNINEKLSFSGFEKEEAIVNFKKVIESYVSRSSCEAP